MTITDIYYAAEESGMYYVLVKHRSEEFLVKLLEDEMEMLQEEYEDEGGLDEFD